MVVKGFKMYHFISLIFISLLLSSCSSKQQYNDISHESNVKNLIDSSYISLSKLKLQGITSDENHEQKVDFYVLDKIYETSHKRPEDVSEDILAIGSKITITKVLECSNCFLFSPVSVLVDIEGYQLESVKPVSLSYQLINVNERNHLITLSKDFFRRVY